MELEAVILAAGFSSRAGTFKMELDFGGKGILERCIEGFYDICTQIYVVGGYQYEKVQRITQRYSKVQMVYNSQYIKGMFSSVKEGVRQVKAERFFFTPGDYPLINQAVCMKMLEESGEIIIPAFNGKKGHPVLMSGKLAKEIFQEAEDSNLKNFINRRGFTLVEVNDKGILMDVDTMDDYYKLLGLRSDKS